MSRLFLMLFLLVASPAMAAPSFFDQVHTCVEVTVKFTEFATLAATSKDDEQGAFMAFIQQEADAQGSTAIRDLFVVLGKLAWSERGQSVQSNAMNLYDKCYSKLGTHT